MPKRPGQKNTLDQFVKRCKNMEEDRDGREENRNGRENKDGREEDIHCMLKFFLTLPITTCACERSFSAMRRLKTWLRASMSDDRLSGLALMHVHNNIKINKESVLRRWDASGHRRIHLAFRKFWSEAGLSSSGDELHLGLVMCSTIYPSFLRYLVAAAVPTHVFLPWGMGVLLHRWSLKWTFCLLLFYFHK